jgi:hypothetical protein
VAIAYLVLEFAVFGRVLPHLPLKYHGDLHEGIRVLAQSSKRSTIPHDYIALVGDSYAQGGGDWLMSADASRNRPFHAAHVVHERTGRDVVSFGASGAGSIRSLISEPVSQCAFISASRRFHLEPPACFVVYFYEGNDLNDNLIDLETRYVPRYGPIQALDAGTFGRFVDDVVLGEDPLLAEAGDLRWTDELFLFDLLRSTARGIARRVVRGDEAEEERPPEWHEGTTNWASVGGRRVNIPDGLQGPALELTEDETALTVQVFERALIRLHSAFPESEIRVLYVPSPLASYEVVSPMVSCQTYHGRAAVYPSGLVETRNRSLAGAIRGIAGRSGFPFVDATGFMREQSAKRLVHGPLDWKHFNRVGYETLSEAILCLLQQCPVGHRDGVPARGSVQCLV